MFGFYFKYYWATGISTGLSVRKSIQISHLLHGEVGNTLHTENSK